MLIVGHFFGWLPLNGSFSAVGPRSGWWFKHGLYLAALFPERCGPSALYPQRYTSLTSFTNSYLWPEWTSTHQCTNDGWCTDRILFLSLCRPRSTFFLCPFSALSQPWSQFFFLELHFLPTPHPVSFSFFLLLKLFPPTHLPPIVPHQLTHLYI